MQTLSLPEPGQVVHVRTGGFVGKRGDPGAWPLPLPPGVETTVDRPSKLAALKILREVAIREKRSDEVLRLHDRIAAERGSSRRSGLGMSGDSDEARVADAIAASHPDRTVEIYVTEAQRLVERADAKQHAQAVGLLARIRDRLGATRAAEWHAILARFRDAHARKRRFQRALDRLTMAPAAAARGRRRPLP